VLNSHKHVVQSAVVGRAVDGKRGSRRLRAADAGLIGEVGRPDGFRQSALTSYKRPSKIIVLDALPATSTGRSSSTNSLSPCTARSCEENRPGDRRCKLE